MCPDSGGAHLQKIRLQRFQWAGPPWVRRGRCRCQASRRCPPRAQTGTLVPMSASLGSNRCRPRTGRIPSVCISGRRRRSGRSGAGAPRGGSRRSFAATIIGKANRSPKPLVFVCSRRCVNPCRCERRLALLHVGEFSRFFDCRHPGPDNQDIQVYGGHAALRAASISVASWSASGPSPRRALSAMSSNPESVQQ